MRTGTKQDVTQDEFTPINETKSGSNLLLPAHKSLISMTPQDSRTIMKVYKSAPATFLMKMRSAIKRQSHPYVNSVLNSQHVSTHGGVCMKSQSPAGVYKYSEKKCTGNDSCLLAELLPSPDVMFDAVQLAWL